MWNDPVVEEVRKVREAYAAKFGFDLEAMAQDLKEKAKQSGREVVSRPPRKPVVTESSAA